MIQKINNFIRQQSQNSKYDKNRRSKLQACIVLSVSLLVCIAVFNIVRRDNQVNSLVHEEIKEILPTDEHTFSFLVVGDWGIGEDDPLRTEDIPFQKKVSKQMKIWADKVKSDLVVSTGDQVYPHGMESIEDQRFVTIFKSFAQGRLASSEWVATLGNHDCEGSAEAFMHLGETTINDMIIEAKRDEGKSGSGWTLGGTKGYYVVEKRIGTGDNFDVLRIVVVNSCTLACSVPDGERNFRCDPTSNNAGIVVGGLPHYTTPEMFTKRAEQLTWLDEVLSQPKPNNAGKLWQIVVSHWPVYSFRGNGPTEAMNKDVLPLLEKYNVHLFFNGHDHSLQHIKRKTNIRNSVGNTEFFGSGAGGFHIHPFLKEKSEGFLNNDAELIHADDEHGFMIVSASTKTNELTVSFISASSGEVMYQTTVRHF